MRLRSRSILILLMWILTGCGSIPFLATPTPTAPPPTPTFTRTPRPTPTSTLIPSPTPVFASYPWKHVWFKYTVESPLEMASQFGLTEEPRLVIYTDGTMIAARTGDSKIRTRVLDTREICTFVNRLDSLGFNELQDSRVTDESNPIYDFGSKYQAVTEGKFANLSMYLTAPQSVSFFEPYRKFLARPMRKVMEYVETFNPGGLKPYVPDRLIIFAQRGRAEGTDEKVRARDWTVDAFSLNDAANVPYTFLEGQLALDVYDLLVKYETHIYLENEMEYTVTMRLLYPHEIVNVGSAPIATPTEERFPVNCNP